MFVEKYVWCAVNIISGYLADRLPSSRGMSGRTEVLQDHSSLGAGMPIPLSGRGVQVLLTLGRNGFRMDCSGNPGGDEEAAWRAARWLSDAGWPSPETWFADHDSVALCSFLPSPI